MANTGQTTDREQSQPTSEESRRPRSTAEWTTLIGSLVVVALLIGAALYEQFASEEAPGTWISIELGIDETTKRDDTFYIPFTATNRGSKPAEDVTIVFTITLDGETVEESTVVVPFLPNSGSADGELITAYDPATHQIEARPATLLSP